MSTPPSLPSGWFPDPHGRYEHRWFNGTAWTADVADGGQRFIDPHGAAPGGFQPYGASAKRGNGPATAAITCGVIALTIAWLPFIVFAGIALAIAAIWTGLVGLRRSKTVDHGRNFAIAGLVLGGAAALLSIVGVLFTLSAWREVTGWIDPGPHDVTIATCNIEPGEIVVRGAITNEDDEPHDYTLYGVVDDPDGLPDIVLLVDDVASGETRDVELRRSIVTSGKCDARIVVHGPLPWGVEMERMNE